ncbi:MAG: hypothetical protein ABW215_00190 [Kibdelosporangium sp.]
MVNRLQPDNDPLIESIRLALTGAAMATKRMADPGAAAAFALGSTRKAVDVGAGLWAVLRTSADSGYQVLCVHNVSEEPRGFLPAPHLDDTSVTFLSGETNTAAVSGGLRCELKPSGFVWLGNSTARSGENTR